MRSLVKDMRVVEIGSRHDIHVADPQRYTAELVQFVDDLRHSGQIPAGA